MIGLWLSYTFDLTSGAAIILVAGLAFLISLPIERMRKATKIKTRPATAERN